MQIDGTTRIEDPLAGRCNRYPTLRSASLQRPPTKSFYQCWVRYELTLFKLTSGRILFFPTNTASFKMSNQNEPSLDEIQWRSPQIVAQMGGLHSNTILFYFAESPFFERTSNNAVIMAQAMNNMAMYHYIQTREAFETRLKTMSGLEFIVGEEPAETGPGMGTGVWVIRKQTRRKRYQDDDEITVHASFFVVGENIYMAPTLADILASRIVREKTNGLAHC
jgi:hypothetical protein